MGLVVRKDASWNSFEELITYAKNNPGKVKYTTSAVNDFNHLIIQNIARINGIKWDCIPATGEATAIPMVLGGHVAFFAGVSSWLPLVEAGKLKILVAFGGKKRMFPDVPTYQELGYDFPSESHLIIIGPPSVPDPIVKKLHDAFKNAMEEPQYEEVLKKMNMQREYRGSAELKEYLVDFNTLWVDLLNKMDIKKKE